MKTIHVPSWIKPHVVGIQSFILEGISYPYLVVLREFGTRSGAPEIFTYRVNDLLVISEAYPEEYRELGLIHVVLEFSAGGQNGEFACLLALNEELRLAEERGLAMKEYIAFRLKFFDDMIEFHQKKSLDTELENHLLTKLKHSQGELRVLSAH